MLQAPQTPARALMDMLERAWQQSPDRYKTQWRPYLASFELPHYTASSLERAHDLARLLPQNATFGLHLVASESSDHSVRGLSAHAWTDRLDHIALSRCRLSDQDVEQGFAHGSFPHVHTLHLASNQLGVRAAGVVARTFLRLSHLDLSANPLGEGGVEALMQGGDMGRLSHINLSRTQPDVRGLRALFHAVGSLETLTLRDNGLDARVLDALPHTEGARVRVLDLSDNLMGERACRALAHQVWFEHVRALDASGNRLDTEALTALAQSSWRPTTLRLSRNRLNAWSVHELIHAPWFDAVETLDLSHNHLDDVGVGALFCAEHLHTLRDLDVRGTSLGDHAMEHWPSGLGLEGLCHLDMSQNVIGDRGVRRIVRDPPPNLRVLKLNGCGLSDASALALAHSEGFATLRRLELGANALSSRGVEALLRSTSLPRGLTLGLYGNPGAR